MEIEIGLDPARHVAERGLHAARGSRRAARDRRPCGARRGGARSAAPACGAARPPRSGPSCCRAPRSGRSGRAARRRAPAPASTLPCWIWTTPMAASWRMASRAIGLRTPKEAGDPRLRRQRVARLQAPVMDRLRDPRDHRIAEPDRHDIGRAERVAVESRHVRRLRCIRRSPSVERSLTDAGQVCN